MPSAIQQIIQYVNVYFCRDSEGSVAKSNFSPARASRVNSTTVEKVKPDSHERSFCGAKSAQTGKGLRLECSNRHQISLQYPLRQFRISHRFPRGLVDARILVQTFLTHANEFRSHKLKYSIATVAVVCLFISIGILSIQNNESWKHRFENLSNGNRETTLFVGYFHVTAWNDVCCVLFDYILQFYLSKDSKHNEYTF